MSPSGESATTEFSGEVTVSSVIIDQLSSGLYESPAACLKELVNNSYDADAKQVYLTVRPDAALIVIDDDGIGMSRADFETHFKRIARSHKRENGEFTQSGRPKVGKIGIGFIAANEICQKLEILSTKRGSTELLHVTLDFEQMRMDADDRRRTDDAVSKADYYGDVSQDAQTNEQFTRIFLSEVKEESMKILNGARTGKGDSNLYGASREMVKAALTRPTLRTWSNFDYYTKTVLEIGLNVPVAYHEGWAGSHSAELENVTLAARTLNFSVSVDGTDLRKPIVFGDYGGRTLVRQFELIGEHVSATGYMYARDMKLTPIELNGSLIRIRNAAVGSYDKSYLNYPGFKSPIFQDWTSAEIYADDRLEAALNIDRRTLRITHPAYVELQELFHEELDRFFAETRKELYGTRSTERKQLTAQTQAREIRELAGEMDSGARRTSNLPASTLETPAPLSKRTVEALTKSYKPTDIIRMVRYAGAEAGISAAQMTRLIETLTETFLR